MGEEIEKRSYRGPMSPLPMMHPTLHRVEISFDSVRGYFLYESFATGLNGKEGIREQKSRYHLPLIEGIEIINPQNGSIRVDYRYPGGDVFQHVFVVPGYTPKERMANSREVYAWMLHELENKVQYEETTLRNWERLKELERKTGIDMEWAVRYKRSMTVYYEREHMTLQTKGQWMAFLPKQIMGLFQTFGAVPTKREMNLIEKLCVPFSDVKYVLFFPSSKEFGLTLYEAQKSGYRLRPHLPSDIELDEEEGVFLFFFKENAPFPSVGMVGPRAFGSVNYTEEFSMMMFGYTYEAYASENDLKEGDPEYASFLLGHNA